VLSSRAVIELDQEDCPVRLTALILATSLLFSSVAMAQTKDKKTAGAPDKAYIQTILDAWSTLNPDNVAKYYDHDPNDVFYDVSPLKYQGWAEYTAGVKPFFTTLKSAKFTANDDATVHHAGNLAWGTSTVKFEMVDQGGKMSTLNCRWTIVWEKKGANWVIVHDHFSAPMEEPK
jgi:ketosteroid isomerase-like protein